MLRTFAQHKPDDLDEVLRKALKHDDVIVRTTAAELLAEQPKVTGMITVLERAFTKAMEMDKHDNDAVLATLDAMAKVDAPLSVDSFYKRLPIRLITWCGRKHSR